jgi:hypothetical protein
MEIFSTTAITEDISHVDTLLRTTTTTTTKISSKIVYRYINNSCYCSQLLLLLLLLLSSTFLPLPLVDAMTMTSSKPAVPVSSSLISSSTVPLATTTTTTTTTTIETPTIVADTAAYNEYVSASIDISDAYVRNGILTGMCSIGICSFILNK